MPPPPPLPLFGASSPIPLAAPGSRRLLLVGWDAADWRILRPLLAAGQMPHLAGLLQRGVSGNLASLRPVLSPMLWTSIATGVRPHRHGVTGFTEITPDGRHVRPVSGHTRRVRALWNMAHLQGLSSVVVNWWPSHPAEPIRGCMVSNDYKNLLATPGPDGRPGFASGCVFPPEREAFYASGRVAPNDLPGDALAPFVAKWAEIDQSRDRRLLSVAKLYCESLNVGQVAAAALAHTSWDLAAVYFDVTDHVGHGFMRYHPPRLPWVNERDFELYSGVVAGIYRHADYALGRLLQQTGPETTVLLVSDHGFASGHDRQAELPTEPAGPAAEHRFHGILVAAGPGLRSGGTVAGASLLDLAPTALAALGLPVGEDLEGRVLTELWAEPHAVTSIPSWEDLPGEDGRGEPRAETAAEPEAAGLALQQLAALGYIDPEATSGGDAVRRTRLELGYQKAVSLMDAQRHADAWELLAALRPEHPDDPRLALRQIDCLLALGLWREGLDTLEATEALLTRRAETATADLARLPAIEDEPPPMPAPDAPPAEHAAWQNQQSQRDFLFRQRRTLTAHTQPNLLLLRLLRVRLLQAGRQRQAADTALAELLGNPPQRRAERRLLGELLLAGKRYEQATGLFLQLLAEEPEDAASWNGLARAEAAQGANETALEAATEALALEANQPLMLNLRARLALRQRRWPEALDAFQQSLVLNGNQPSVHLRLASIADRFLGDPALALAHRDQAGALREAGRREKRRRQTLFRRHAKLPETVEPALEVVIEQLGQWPSLGDDILVVTGLPRSGTSLVMQMLAAAEVPILTDGRRSPDPSNPRGFFEFEPVRRLARDSSWLPAARGRALKIVSPLLQYLPTSEGLRLLIVERDVDEVIASQRRMRQQEGHDPLSATQEASLRRSYARMTRQLRAMVAQRHLPHLILSHQQLLAAPEPTARQLAEWLQCPAATPSMAAVVDPALWRQRGRDAKA